MHAFIKMKLFRNLSDNISKLRFFEIFDTSRVAVVFLVSPVRQLIGNVFVTAIESKISTAPYRLVSTLVPTRRVERVCYNNASVLGSQLVYVSHQLTCACVIVKLIVTEGYVDVNQRGVVLIDNVLHILEQLLVAVSTVESWIEEL